MEKEHQKVAKDLKVIQIEESKIKEENKVVAVVAAAVVKANQEIKETKKILRKIKRSINTKRTISIAKIKDTSMITIKKMKNQTHLH